ncbi:MAG TPA: hypothetical protein VIN08_17505 [Ohtaekwangia sp.]|uniref:nSTAND3 domain-containing NTPase n=1 Tax=Ohtaekwangia sp. TaxID=2066019 RepID=UPI002F959F78
MNITLYGPQGYEYQYKVTLLVSLLFHKKMPKIYIEKINNEDVVLSIKNESGEIRVQIQIKREQENLDLEKLAEWLAHFEDRASDANLFQRIIDKVDETVVFITRSRCSDDVVMLKSPFNSLEEKKKLNITRTSKIKFTNALGNLKHGPTDLKTDREKFCKKQATAIKTVKNLAEILKHVTIWEEATDEKIDREIESQLLYLHHIPSSQIRHIYFQLLEVVKEGRGGNQDIFPLIADILRKNKAGRPVTASFPFERPDEEHLLEGLQSEGVLLLTGISLCGKSEAAKKLAAQLFDAGYAYSQSNEPSDINRFFLSNVGEEKVAVLEDPWGHAEVAPSSENRKREIEQLILNRQPHHKLIITCSISILMELFGTRQLKDYKIQNIHWRDLTIRHGAPLSDYWRTTAIRNNIDPAAIAAISQDLLTSDQEYLLQIGQLRYLASCEKAELVNKSIEELLYLARKSSREIATSIADKDIYYAEVFAVLALCSTPIIGIAKLDLAYILGSGQERLGFINKRESRLTLDQSEIYPSYGQGLALTDRAFNVLEFLEHRQLIIIHDNIIKFSHPNYYEAGRFLFTGRGTQGWQETIIKYLSRATSCLNPENAFLAVRQYSFISSGIREDLKHRVIDTAFASIDSIYPSVEDNSIAFLANNIKDVPESNRESLVALLQEGNTSDEYIKWHDSNTPYISHEYQYNGILYTPDAQAVERAYETLQLQRLPSIEDGWNYVESLKDGRAIPQGHFELLLSYKETFLRKDVIMHLLRCVETQGQALINQIFNDENPSIVFAAIRASFVNWNRFSEDTKTLLRQRIKGAIGKEQVAIRCARVIVTLAAHYGNEGIFTLDELTGSEQKDIWNLWASVYPIVVKTLPLDGIFYDTARFGATMEEAIKHIDGDVGMQVLESWFEFIDKRIRTGKMLDEFEMAVADLLIALTRDNHLIRRPLFLKLLNYPDTDFLLSSLKWMMSNWNLLDDSEKNDIISLLHSERLDKRWIKALLLTRGTLQPEIVNEILGDSHFFERDIDHFVREMPAQLLMDCLHFYCGTTYPLYRLAIHGKNSDLWISIMTYILTTNYEIGFDICLQDFLRDGVNSFPMKWVNPENIWSAICATGQKKDLIIESLIFNTGSCTCSLRDTNMLWRVLTDSYRHNNQIDLLVKNIVSNIEMFQQTNHIGDFYDLLTHNNLVNQTLEATTPDYTLLALLETFRGVTYLADDDVLSTFTALLVLFQGRALRLHYTFEVITSVAPNLPAKVNSILAALPNQINDVGKKRLTECEAKTQLALENWVSLFTETQPVN